MEGQDEQWLGLVDYPGYEVSDAGRVRSLRKPGQRAGAAYRETPQYLKGFGTGKAKVYRAVHLRTRHGKLRSATVHQLVLTAFVGPKPEGHVTRHLDGNPGNNRLENLRWGTFLENSQDTTRHGTLALGERHGRSKLTTAAVRDIRAAIGRGETRAVLAVRHGVAERTVGHAITGYTWSHVI